MTTLKPEEIQAASEWFNSHYCQSECAHYNTICRALAFTLAANGEPSDGMYELSTDIATYDLRPIAMYKCFIDKIWEELRGMDGV